MNGLARDHEALNEFCILLKAYKTDPDKWNKIYTYDTYNNGWYYSDGVKKTAFVNRT